MLSLIWSSSRDQFLSSNTRLIENTFISNHEIERLNAVLFAPVWLNLGGVLIELIIAVASLGTWVRSIPGFILLCPDCSMDDLWVISGSSLSCSEYSTSDLRVISVRFAGRLWIISVCSLSCFLNVFLVSSALTSSLLRTLSEFFE